MGLIGSAISFFLGEEQIELIFYSYFYFIFRPLISDLGLDISRLLIIILLLVLTLGSEFFYFFSFATLNKSTTLLAFTFSSDFTYDVNYVSIFLDSEWGGL